MVGYYTSMKIAIAGSMSFAQEMIDTKSQLEKRGHEVRIPHETQAHITSPQIVHDPSESLKWVLEQDAMRKGFENDVWADALLVLNYEKNNVKGYIGISTLMEMAIAFYFKKKLFLFNDVPHWDEERWAHEVAMTQPTILHGDLSKIS